MVSPDQSEGGLEPDGAKKPCYSKESEEGETHRARTATIVDGSRGAQGARVGPQAWKRMDESRNTGACP